MERVAPLPEPWSPEDAESIGRWGHPEVTYDPPLLVRCLQRHPKLAARTRALGEGFYLHGRLPARTRTLAILRICALVRSEYEWGGQSAVWGPEAGLTEDECDALVTGGPSDPRWTPDERRLLTAVDEIEATGTWSDETWAGLGRDLDDEQRMELLIVVGWYRMICTLCNGMALPLENWMRRWPAGAGS